MKNFTNETTGYEQFQAYIAFKKMLDSYLLERDFEKVLSFLEDDVCCIGTGKDEIAFNKSEISKVLRAELEVVSEPIEYKIGFICGKELAKNIWDVHASIEMIIPIEGEKTPYAVRFTGCIRLLEKGFVIVSAHMSEPSSNVKEKMRMLLKHSSDNVSGDQVQAEQIIFDIMSKSMPGGIVCGYAEEGFPLYFVNEQYLELLGYSSYEEYYKDANGLGITHIHPDDVDMVNSEIMNSYSADVQYGIEYRVRHKDGHYISVYDIGKKMITPDNREFIICVLYDMTKDAKLKEVLKRESTYDALTGVYNRRGGVQAIEHELEYAKGYSFAFFDIDNLKLLNDVYSHIAGDAALKRFAELLVEHFDERTIFSRFGGDEFVAFFKEKLDKARIEEIFANFEKEYCSFIEENYPKSHSSVSVGCVVGTVKRSFEELCMVADELMYDIKKNGKRGYKIKDIG